MLYSIGYGNLKKEEFIEKLKEYKINKLIDIRTIPFSRFQVWTNKFNLPKSLSEISVKYEHIIELGYKTRYPDFIVEAKLKDLIELSQYTNIVLMCAELDHHKCHRGELLVEPIIKSLGAEYEHIEFTKPINTSNNILSKPMGESSNVGQLSFT